MALERAPVAAAADTPTAVAKQEIAHANLKKKEEEQEEEKEDVYTRIPELLATERPARKLLSFDWARGYVSPFRPSPQDALSAALARLSNIHNPHHTHTFSSSVRISSSTSSSTSSSSSSALSFPPSLPSGPRVLLDLGCGDGDVLMAALSHFPSLNCAIGIDLDMQLLTRAHERLSHASLRERALLYCGDFLDTAEGLLPVHNSHTVTSLCHMHPYQVQTENITTHSHTAPDVNASAGDRVQMHSLLDRADVIFVYLLPEALRKLEPLLVTCLARGDVTVISMQWPLPSVDPLDHNTKDGFYLYRKM